MKKVTVIGGGTGTFVVLSALKKFDFDLAAIVAMTDSGGSTGRLRDQLGVLPPGDLRQCLVALSEAPSLWRKLFLYRFRQGDLKGHNFGNIFLSALEKVTKGYDEVLETASYVLDVRGEVIPSTFSKTNLCVRYTNGKTICGEGRIDVNYHEKSKIEEAYLRPEARANPRAIERIKESEYLIFGPGDLYVSTIAPLLVREVSFAVKKSHAKIVYIVNLMTRYGQTPQYGAMDHVRDLAKYTGRTPDIVLTNTAMIPDDIVQAYKTEGEQQVSNDLSSFGFGGKIIEGDIIDVKKFRKDEAEEFVDPKVRSILRHDSHKLGKVLKNLMQ